MSTFVLAGGGSLGHVTPSLAVAEEAKSRFPDARIVFIASNRSDESMMITRAGFEHIALHAAKFPRTISLAAILFPIRFPASLLRSFSLLRKLRPSVVFGKGGYVSVPVILAARALGIPIVVHTSDAVPNMSDKILMWCARTICTGFPLPDLRYKHLHTGNPVRRMIASGSTDAAKRITGFSGNRPVVMIIGGSQGSLILNSAVDRCFQELVDHADIVHLTGVGKKIQRTHARYWSKEEVDGDLAHLYALADVVVTRAGAAVLSELAALKKATIIVPLSGVAHDHQVKNAEVLESAGACIHLPEPSLDRLFETVQTLITDEEKNRALGAALHSFFPAGATMRIAGTLLDAAAQGR